MLLAVSYRDVRHGQPWGAKLSGQRSLIRKDGNLTVRPSCDGEHQGRREPGSCGTVNSGEALINVVTKDKRKMLNRLDQKVRGQVQGLLILQRCDL